MSISRRLACISNPTCALQLGPVCMTTIIAIMATVDPQAIRTAQRLAVGLYSINGFDMSPPSTTLENGKKLIAYRAQLTIEAIRKAIAKRRATQQ